MTCPACDAAHVEVFHELAGAPVHSCLLLDDAAEARSFPTGTIRLAFCHRCGFVWNEAFDRAMSAYSTRYEETQGFSPRFQAFAEALAQRWVERYDLRHRRLIEIGCGKGEFLARMCEIGDNEGIGIDPSYVPGRLPADLDDRIVFIQDLYSKDYGPIDADAVICRHTLEHVQPVAEFLSAVRHGLGNRTDTVILFELPDVRRVLEEVAFWDIYYEHCSYFSAGSLARLFRQTGFEPLDLWTAFDDQYLLIEARPSPRPVTGPLLPGEDDLEPMRRAVDHFVESYASTVDRWRAELSAAGARRTAVWGAGSKGVAYLTTLGVSEEVDVVVDINPYKQGMFMAGTGHPIVSPEALRSYRPDVVVAMNPVYRDEIGQSLTDLGVHAQLLCV